MNIYKVRDNLLNTIRGKEAYLAAINKERTMVGLRDGEATALSAIAQFLAINLEELYGILNDVQVCCKQASDDSWERNPDRMGGQYTQEEIDRADRWI